ncbi:MAG: acyl carrier protein [Sneathiella sp.]|nr:acyl carrier protein [Sneathiella sp.]
MSISSLQQAKSIVSEILEINSTQIDDDATIETLDKWDSLNHMRILMQLEEQFETSIDTEIAMEMFSISAISNWIETHR